MAFRISRSIKLKLRLSYLALIVLSALAAVVSFSMLSRVNAFQETKSKIGVLMTELNESRKAEKDVMLYDRRTVDFLVDGESRSTLDHAEHMEAIFAILDDLAEDEIIQSLGLEDAIHKVERSSRGYQLTFEELVRQMMKRGFKDHGLEGEMRDFVHNLQDCESDSEKVFAFQLRRHEKDFFMRLDDKYVFRLHQTADDFLAFLSQRTMPHMTEEYLYRVTNGIMAYRHHFDKIVKADRIIGLTGDDGLRGRLKEQASVVEPQIDYLYEAINEGAAQQQKNALTVMISSFAVLFVVGVLMSFRLSSAISRPIILLDNVTKKILGGKEDAESELQGLYLKDEIGSLINNFRAMLSDLRSNMVLVNEKNAKLEKAKEADMKRNWTMEGLALFGEILKNPDDQELVGKEVIGNLVKYLKASQGALFVVGDTHHGEEPFLEMIGRYAWTRHKKVGDRVGYGDGLVGSAWRDRETLYFTDIPSDYIHIKSGLGTAQPQSLLIVPIKNQQEVIGVIEIASLYQFKDYEIEFVERLAERIATTLTAVKLQARTKVLLHSSQQLTEELQANEEEMRQNMEELQATQEEMARSTQDLRDSIDKSNQLFHIHQGVVNKMYEGVVVANDRFLVEYVNNFVVRKLSYSQDELQSRPIDQLFVSNIRSMLQNMENDPSYILNHFTESQDVEILDKFGNAMPAGLVVTKIEEGGQNYFAFLFKKKTKSMGGEDLLSQLMNNPHLSTRPIKVR